MEIRETESSDGTVLALVGNLDSQTSGQFQEKITTLLGQGKRRFVVDLEQLAYLSSAGLRVLLMLAKKLDLTDGGVTLCAPNEHVRSVLAVAGFDKILAIFPTREQALAGLPSRNPPAVLARLAVRLLAAPPRPHGGEPAAATGLADSAGRLLALAAPPRPRVPAGRAVPPPLPPPRVPAEPAAPPPPPPPAESGAAQGPPSSPTSSSLLERAWGRLASLVSRKP